MTDLIQIENGQLTTETIKRILLLQEQKKKADEAWDLVKERLCEVMEANGILKVETPEATITYVAPTTTERFDSKTFKKECPEIYDEYAKISPVSARVLVTAR